MVYLSGAATDTPAEIPQSEVTNSATYRLYNHQGPSGGYHEKKTCKKLKLETLKLNLEKIVGRYLI